MLDVIYEYLRLSGFGQVQWPNLVMIAIGLLFIFLAIKKGFEPLLLVPIGFGILIGNIPYDSDQLPLSVYDGPVAEEALAYFVAEDPIQVARVGEAGEVVVETLEPWTPIPDAYHFRAEGWVRQGKAIMLNLHTRFSAPYRLPPEHDWQTNPIVPLGQGRQIYVGPYQEVTVVNEEGVPERVWQREDPAELREADVKWPQLWNPEKQDPANASVMYWLYAGVGLGFFPPLIFLGIGALTDFGPMLANPKTLLLGAAAQFGIFGALMGALLLGFTPEQAGSIGIIGGADGPTAIFTCAQLAPELLGAVALAAYSYMAMVPIIQPPVVKLLTTKKERAIRMQQLKPVSKTTRIVFPLAGFLLTAFIANGALPLLGMLFFGNLLRECLVTDRLAKTAQTAFIDIVTILLGVTVGAKTTAANFLSWQTIYIFLLGIGAFIIATAAGVIFGKIMNWMTKEPINPMIGAAGVSAVPMSARVVHRMGQQEDPQNYLLMHAMGPNVAGVIGSAVAAGVLLSKLAG